MIACHSSWYSWYSMWVEVDVGRLGMCRRKKNPNPDLTTVRANPCAWRYVSAASSVEQIRKRSQFALSEQRITIMATGIQQEVQEGTQWAWNVWMIWTKQVQLFLNHAIFSFWIQLDLPKPYGFTSWTKDLDSWIPFLGVSPSNDNFVSRIQHIPKDYELQEWNLNC